MFRIPHTRACRPRRANPPAPGPTAAPGHLRRRVLSAVSRDRRPAPSATRVCAHAPPWTLLAPIALTAAAVVALLAFHHTARPRAFVSTPGIETPASGARASLRRIGSYGELTVSGMPEPPIGEVYEVWLSHGGGPPQPTDALFTVTDGGDGSVDVPGPLDGAREVLVTSEPLGGSSSPTSAPVLRVPVAG
jgi:Anti-sigma-K factor rskA